MRNAALPAFVPPQLATLVSEPPSGDEWIHELKYDGYRMLARVQNRRASLLSRRGNDWTERMASLAVEIAALPVRTAVIDGEVVVFDEHGITRFQLLQNALGEGAGDGRTLYVAFDLLHLDGRDLRAEPLLARKERLRLLLARLPKTSRVRYSDHVEGNGKAFFRSACRAGVEGILSKLATGRWTANRTREWLKVKCVRSQELVIGGFTPPAGTRSGFGSLLLGVHDAGGLRYAGKVGTGFTDESLAELRERLRALERPTSPFVDRPTGARLRDVRWVEPKLVANVRFTEWTSDGRLRHPSFEGLREDKMAKEVVREREAPTSRRREALRSKTVAAPKRSSRASRPRATGRKAPAAKARASSPSDLVVEGVRITNPDRVIEPVSGTTKGDVARHYAKVGPKMLPYVERRPLALVRCPEGTAKGCFFQKHVMPGWPPQVKGIRVRESDGEIRDYVMVDSVAGLVALAQVGTIEVHVWGSKAGDPESPGRMVIDLDPAPGVPWSKVVEAAREARARLEAAGFASEPVTTGGKGLHVVAPMGRRRLTWDAVKELTHSLATAMAAERPDRYLAKASKSERRGKVFVDWLRNIRGATAVAPYSMRARAGTPMARPVTWAAIPRLDPGKPPRPAAITPRRSKSR